MMDYPSAFQERIKGQLPQEADLLFSALKQDSSTHLSANNPHTTLPEEIPLLILDQW